MQIKEFLYLLLFKHRAQSLNFMSAVLSSLQTHITNRNAAKHTVHTDVFFTVAATFHHSRLVGRLGACGRNERVLRQRTSTRMTRFTAAIAVSHFALFTHNRGLGRFGFFAELTINNSIRFCIIAIDNIFQEAVTRESIDLSAV